MREPPTTSAGIRELRLMKLASVHRAAAVACDTRIEQLSNIHRIEHIGAIAEVAAHFDFPAFGENRMSLRVAQTLQHAADPLARTSAAKIDRRRLKQADVILVEQAV